MVFLCCSQALTHDFGRFREAGPIGSMQSPIHIWETPPSLQHCSGESVFGAGGGGNGFGLGVGIGLGNLCSIGSTCWEETEFTSGGICIH